MIGCREIWQTGETDPAAVECLEKSLGIKHIIAEILYRRGYKTVDLASDFLNPSISRIEDPFLMPHMAEAVSILSQVVAKKGKICIFGDYDVDGITSSVLLGRVLSSMGVQSSIFLPNRFTDGYGVTHAGLEKCITLYDPDLLITVDCGANSESLLVPLSRRIKIIVTDHHEMDTNKTFPYPVINPFRVKGSTPLAGVGVAFKLCHALYKKLKKEG